MDVHSTLRKGWGVRAKMLVPQWQGYYFLFSKHPNITQFIKDMQLFMNLQGMLPYSNRIWPGLTEFGPLLWQAKQTVLAQC